MTHVLDASAVLALLNGEPGAERVVAVMPDALICTVNLSEVGAKILRKGGTPDEAQRLVNRLGFTVADFDENLAWSTAGLRARTDPAGLSLADRACIALAIRERGIALTADRAWARLDLECHVELIR